MSTISFPKMFDNKKSMNLSYSYRNIHESLTSLLLTSPGELLGDPEYGCDIKTKLFDIKSITNMVELRNIIIAAINKYISYINVSSEDIKIYTNNDNKYKITIHYSMNNNSNKSHYYELVL